MSQPLEISAAAESHEEVFLARYERLRAWALQLTAGDQARAEDLVQDAFIHFTLARPALTQVQNLDGYLYSVLRNLNVSHLRRQQRLQSRTLSVVEYDSAEVSLCATDPRDLIRVQDELRACCRYACVRKESAKAGSVLILRFLHGYYPREIAAVMRATRAAVEERLRVARSEARQYLKDPASLRFIREDKAQPQPHAAARTGGVLTTDELLRELRDTVWQSRRGNCLPDTLLDSLYGGAARAALETVPLAHAVSCPRCLDEINRRLGLAPLAERYPTDTLAKEACPKERDDDADDDDGAGGDMTGADAAEFYRRSRRRARAVFEHRPAELGISLNGQLVAAQKIGAAVNEQTLNVGPGEPVEFIEVVSEQEVRLLFLDLSQRAAGEQQWLTRVELSDERTLEATVNFAGPAPVVQVIYRDPLLAPEAAAHTNSVAEGVPLREVTTKAAAEDEQTTDARPRTGARARRWARGVSATLGRLWRSFMSRGFFMRPGTLAAALSLVLIAVLLFVRLHVPTVSAAELIHRSINREQAVAADASLVVHRTLYFEERQAGRGDVLARRRIETWQSAARGVRARRVFDEHDNLVAGAWLKPDGAGTLYRRGAAAEARGAQSLAAPQTLDGDAWLIDLSATDFAALVGDLARVRVAETGGAYVLDYERAGAEAGLVRAALRLHSADLRAFDETLVVRRAGETREYHLAESAYERVPAAQVAPAVFQPDAVLTTPAAELKEAGKGGARVENTPAVDGAAGHKEPSVASAELEVEVAYLLNQIKADLGEQVSLRRTAAGALRVEALVESAARKEEVLRALRPVGDNPAVVVDVKTVAEAVQRRAQENGPGQEVTREVEVQTGRVPADGELRRYFGARLVGDERIAEESRQFAARAMTHSRQALLHASALKQLTGRFSPAETAALTPEARRKWLALLAGHARAVEREVAALRAELGAVFAPSGAGVGSVAQESVSAANLAQAAERLLQLSYAHDEAVRSAFTLAAEQGTTARIKSAQFWRSLRTAEALAAGLQGIAQD